MQDLPAKLMNAQLNAQQNDHNVSVHVKRHHRPGRPGAFTVQVNETFGANTKFNPSHSPEVSTSEESSSSTTSTSTTTSSTEADYDYIEYDVSYDTTTTTGGAKNKHHQKHISIGIDVGVPKGKKTTPGAHGTPHSGSTTVLAAPGQAAGRQVVERTKIAGSAGNVVDVHDGTVNGHVITPTQQAALVQAYYMSVQNFQNGVSLSGSTMVRADAILSAAGAGARPVV
jgi:hypothetical protein